MNLDPKTPLVSEAECAKALGLSIDWLRKDRKTLGTLPHIRMPSGAIRYSLQRCAEALAAHERGGRPVAKP
jgi:hypothetical protein